MYIPGELLEEENVIEIVELHNENPKPAVRFDSKPSLDMVEEVVDVAELGI